MENAVIMGQQKSASSLPPFTLTSQSSSHKYNSQDILRREEVVQPLRPIGGIVEGEGWEMLSLLFLQLWTSSYHHRFCHHYLCNN